MEIFYQTLNIAVKISCFGIFLVVLHCLGKRTLVTQEENSEKFLSLETSLNGVSKEMNEVRLEIIQQSGWSVRDCETVGRNTETVKSELSIFKVKVDEDIKSLNKQMDALNKDLLWIKFQRGYNPEKENPKD